MKITTNATPPTAARVRHNYADLIKALQGNYGWVSVSTSEIAGKTKAQVQTSIHAACNRAGIPVETRTTSTEVYIRALSPSEVHDAGQ